MSMRLTCAEKQQLADLLLEFGRKTQEAAANARLAEIQAGIGRLAEDHQRREIGRGDFKSFGHFLQTVVRAEQQEPAARQLLTRAATGADEGDPSSGGFLVPPTFLQELVGSIYEEASLAPLCDQVLVDNPTDVRLIATDETSRADGSRWGGSLAYWQDEGTTVPTSFSKWRNVTFSAKKLISLCVVTEELFRDVPALDRHVKRVLTSEFSFQLDRVILTGSGAGVPLGIINAPATIPVAKESGQPAGTITAANVSAMWSRMPAPCRRRCVWLINEDTESALDAMTETVGMSGAPAPDAVRLFMVPDGKGGAVPTLKGRPVLTIEQCPTLGSVGDIVLADLSQYVIVGSAMKGALSLDVNFVSYQSTFRFTLRLDGQPIWASPITPFNGGNVRSPFVTLAART